MEANKLNMKIRAKIILTAALAAALCGFQTAPAAVTNVAATATMGNPVIARGTGLEITRGDLDGAMTGIKTQNLEPAQILQIQRQMLTRLIETKLLLTKATDADKAAGASAAKQHMTALLENFGSSDELNKQLQAVGETPEMERSKYADQITAQTAVLRELKITVSDDDVQKFYDANRISKFEAPEMARVSHILIYTIDPVTRAALPADKQQARRNQADALLKAIRGGMDFATVAKQYSEDPGSKANGRETPPFQRGEMAPDFEGAAFALTNNQVSGVITTSIGFQIIKMVEKTPAIRTPYLTATPKIKDFLAQQQMQKLAPAYMDGLKKAAAVEILDPNLKPVAATGSGTPATTPVTAPKP